jgi:hypothetical protein
LLNLKDSPPPLILALDPMETSQEFIERTQSAVESLFIGIDSYLHILRRALPPVLVGTYSSETEHEDALERWMNENADAIEAGFQEQRAFMSEKYALTVLCESLLQVACAAIRLYSKNRSIPDEFLGIAKDSHAPFCIGRRVREVPIGLIVLAARNQYNHIEDHKLHILSSTVLSGLRQSMDMELVWVIQPLISTSNWHGTTLVTSWAF